jgi:hypothetical protein
LEITEKEFSLLGIALISAQRVEFLLYGLAAHAAHTPTGQGEKRFRDLTPDEFLRGNSDALNATLGQLLRTFGDIFLLKTPDLIAFCKDRNLIVHDYMRVFHMNIRDAPRREDGNEFLLNFIERADHWEKVLRGLLNELRKATAAVHNRNTEVVLTPTDLEQMQIFMEQAVKFYSYKMGQ